MNLKKLLLSIFLLLIGWAATAQITGRFTLKGTVVDSAGAVLPGATVMLLTPQDSSLLSYGRTNEQGQLEFKNLKRTAYLLKISYVGYLPYEKLVNNQDSYVTDLDSIQLTMLNQDLFEVVIKTARAPLSIRGDTVEYNASSFKVPPGSTVEDLLRRLPGMQVEQDGTVKAQGQEVKRVTVDGKRFFGDDPKMATKNLPAEAISKVQVFNGKSEQSRITGVDDGKQEKTLNLELKDSHKKGGFGKATVGGGTDNRAEGKVNYNRFSDKQQFAIVGFGNNTNQSGLGWNDYQDFRGSQSFNWGEDGDFGFSSGRNFIIISDDNNEENLTISGGRDQRDGGFSKNWAGGVNYNFEDKKTKFSTNYFYNNTERTLDALANRENFLANGTFRTTDDNSKLNVNTNHRGGIRFEKTIDSLNTIIVISNARLGNGSNRFSSFQQFFQDQNRLATESTIANDARFNSFAMGNTAIYRHKFAKKGRNFAASIGYNINNTNGDASQLSVNKFYKKEIDQPEILNINQNNLTNSQTNQLKGSLYMIEPFAKRFYWETFYNTSIRRDQVDRDVFDIGFETSVKNNVLSRYYTNQLTYNRVGSSVRYSYKGLNFSAGLAAVRFDLRGEFKSDQSATETTKVERRFQQLTPNATLNFDLKNNKYLYFNYSMSVEEPTVRDLQPVVDNSNPLFIREGNPGLVPQLTNSFSLGFNMFNPGNFSRLFANLNYNTYENQIIYNQSIDQNLITRTKPMNISGGNSVGGYLDAGIPLVKTKSTIGAFTSISYSKNLQFVNDILNETNNNNYRFGTNISLTSNDKFSLYANASWGINNARYSLSSSQNQKILNNSYGAEMNYKLPSDIYFNSRFNLNTFKNSRFDFNQTQPILNLSVYKIFLKDKKGEVRLTSYDVFNQNKGISQFASQNFVSNQQVRTLARYFMLSFTYNMRGVTAKIRREGY